MDRATQRQLFEEIEGYFATRSTKLAEREEAHPASRYYDPTHFERERQLIWSTPQIVGHSSSIPTAGDFITHDALGIPLLICRQSDGSLKAFLNICTHRGARIATEPVGNASRFSCRYHAWTFRNDGQLVGVPRDSFPCLERGEAGLVKVAAEERHGLIWIVATPDADIDVATHLGAFDMELGNFGLGDFILHHGETISAEINWKYVIDGFMEVYHFPKLHEASIAPYFYGNHSPFDAFGLNGRLVGVRKSFDTIHGKQFDEIEMLPHIAANYFIFPNSVGVWQGDHFEFWTAYPGPTPGVCKILIQMLIPASMATPQYVERWNRNWDIMIDTVMKEDWAISKEIQDALPHIRNGNVIFGANEPGMQHFHGSLEKVIYQDSGQ